LTIQLFSYNTSRGMIISFPFNTSNNLHNGFEDGSVPSIMMTGNNVASMKPSFLDWTHIKCSSSQGGYRN